MTITISLQQDYAKRRDLILDILERAGFRCYRPRGAYYVITDISSFGFTDDVSFVRHLIEDVGVAAVPGSSFYDNPADGSQQIRFCFCKKYETLEAAGKKLLSAYPISIAATCRLEDFDVTRFSAPGNHSSRSRQRFRTGPWRFKRPFGPADTRVSPALSNRRVWTFRFGVRRMARNGDRNP